MAGTRPVPRFRRKVSPALPLVPPRPPGLHCPAALLCFQAGPHSEQARAASLVLWGGGGGRPGRWLWSRGAGARSRQVFSVVCAPPAQVPPLNSAGTDAEAPGVPGPRAGAAGASTVRPRRRREVPAQAVAWALSRCPQPPQTPPLLAADLAQFRPAAAELSLSLLARWRRAGHCRPCFRLSSRCASWSPGLRARAPGGCWSWRIGKHGSPRFPMVGTHRAGDAFWRAPGFFGACQSSLGGRAAPSAPPTQHGDP